MNEKAIFSTYFAAVRQGDAREESFYPALADMLAEMARATSRTDVRVTTLPDQPRAATQISASGMGRTMSKPRSRTKSGWTAPKNPNSFSTTEPHFRTIRTYCRMVPALWLTLTFQKRIDGK